MTLDLAARALVLMVIGSGLCWSLRPTTAALRHTVWRVTVLVTLALPLSAAISPSWRPLALVNATDTARVEAGEPSGLHSGVEVAGAHGPGTVATTVARLSANAQEVWLAGTLTVAAYFALGYLQLARVRRRSRPAPLAWTAAAARLGARARLKVFPEVLVSADISGPLVTGCVRPAVLIPPAACEWTDARRDAVLVHELAHVRRGDLASQITAQALAALHWFNPLAWHLLGQMRRERERACDDEVLRAGVAPLAYATELLAIAAAAPVRRVPAAAVSMARPSELEGRLLAVLDTTPCANRRAAGMVPLVVVAASVLVGGATAAPSPAGPARIRSATGATGALIPPAPDEDLARAAVQDLRAAGDAAARERATLALAVSTGPGVVPALLDALRDPAPGVREKAAVALAWRRDGRIGPALLSAAADPSPGVREKVLVALAFSDEPAASAAIRTARSDPDAGVRQKAAALSVLR